MTVILAKIRAIRVFYFMARKMNLVVPIMRINYFISMYCSMVPVPTVLTINTYTVRVRD